MELDVSPKDPPMVFKDKPKPSSTFKDKKKELKHKMSHTGNRETMKNK